MSSSKKRTRPNPSGNPSGNSPSGKPSGRPSGPRTHLSSDFAKRPKHKVGRRAAVAANVTETKFTVGSVTVRAQDGVGRGVGRGGGRGKRGSGRGGREGEEGTKESESEPTTPTTRFGRLAELRSSRGRSVGLLLATLTHHSTSARLSALGGLKDCLGDGDGSSRSSREIRERGEAVLASLSALLPGVMRTCCLDDDGTVRDGAREVLRLVGRTVDGGNEGEKEELADRRDGSDGSGGGGRGGIGSRLGGQDAPGAKESRAGNVSGGVNGGGNGGGKISGGSGNISGGNHSNTIAPTQPPPQPPQPPPQPQPTTTTNSSSRHLQPHLPLLLAYVISALNSLDVDIRLDGVSTLSIVISLVGRQAIGMMVGDARDEKGGMMGGGSAGQGWGGRGGREGTAEGTGIDVPRILAAFGRVMNDARQKNRGGAAAAGGAAGAVGTAKKGGGKKKKNNNTKGVPGSSHQAAHNANANAKMAGVLRCLVQLLQCAASAGTSASTSTSSSANGAATGSAFASTAGSANENNWEYDDYAVANADPELIFRQGGYATNAVLAYRDGEATVPTTSVRSLNMLGGIHTPDNMNSYTANNKVPGDTITSASASVNGGLDISVQLELDRCFRDRLVELVQAGYSPGNGGGLCLSAAYLEEIGALLSAIRLVWSLYTKTMLDRWNNETGRAGDDGRDGGNQRKSSKSGKKDDVSKIASLLSAIQSQLIDMLPLMSGDGGGRQSGSAGVSDDSPTRRYDATNALLCSVIADIGSGGVEAANSGANWVKVVFDYVLPRLQYDESAGDEGGVDPTLLRVVGQLLLGPYLDNEQHYRRELLQQFYSTFFPDDAEASGTEQGNSGSSINGDLCCSASGRMAAMLLVQLLQRDFIPYEQSRAWAAPDGKNDDVIMIGTKATYLLRYVYFWGDRYPNESHKVLVALLDVARLYSTGSPSAIDGTIMEVFEDDRNDADNTGYNAFGSDPRFNPIAGQLRHAIGDLFVQPKKSQQGTMRSKKSTFEVLPSPTQRLLMGLLGMLQYPQESTVLAIAKICIKTEMSNSGKDYIVDVMHSIRMTMPMQLYLTFLVNSSGISSAFNSKKSKQNENQDAQDSYERLFSYDCHIERLCRALNRCGGDSILPMINPLLMSWLEQSKTDTNELNIAIKKRAAISIIACIALHSFDCIDFSPSLETAIVGTACTMLMKDVEEEDDRIRFLTPLYALFAAQSDILSSVFLRMKKIIDNSVDESSARGFMRNTTLMLKNSELSGHLKQPDMADTMESIAVSLEESLSDGPLDRMGGSFRTEIQIHLGRQLK